MSIGNLGDLASVVEDQDLQGLSCLHVKTNCRLLISPRCMANNVNVSGLYSVSMLVSHCEKLSQGRHQVQLWGMLPGTMSWAGQLRMGSGIAS